MPRGRHLVLLAVLALLALAAAEARAERHVVRFTTPRWNAWPDSIGRPCEASPDSATNLAEEELWQVERSRVVQRHAALAPGALDSFIVEIGAEEQASYFVTALKKNGRRSCNGKVITLHGRVGVYPDSDRASGPWLGVPRPNPAGGLVAVPWCLPEAARVRLEVVDVAGRVVARLADGVQPAGVHVALWDARAAAPGIYLVRAAVGPWRAVRRELVIR